ncbi:hypothetical protein GNF80_08150 [Clostridium perfringens]|nr:hypothetical protein [Clostridium perfringens]
MELLGIIIGILAFGVAFFVWSKQKLELFKIEDAAIENMTEKDRKEVSKSLALPIALLGVLLISVVFNSDKWGSSVIFILIGVVALFVYVEKRTIDGINTMFKSKKAKVKINKKRK